MTRTFLTTCSAWTFSAILALSAFSSCGNPKQDDSAEAEEAWEEESDTPSSMVTGGTFTFGTDVEEGPIGSVMIYPLDDSTAIFYLDVCKGAPSYNLGQLLGKIAISGNTGTYGSDSDECALKFEFSSGKVRISTKNGQHECGFGFGVYADETYQLTDESLPEYFIGGEGDTTYFESLISEE